MSVDTVTLFLALLALTLQPAILGCAGALTRRRSRASVVALLAPYAPWSAAAIAVTCMLGSLYLSEVAHFVPCRLCWYQRIAMYPLALLLPIAAATHDVNIRRYARPLCVGGAISIYHLFVERFPSLEGGACDPNNPCSLIRVNRFGYLTIPTMALTGFTAIFLLVSMHRSQSKPES